MKNISKTIASAVMLCAVFAMSTAQAVPSFARQTTMSCSSCHEQHFPTLNAFGRSFKANGYNLIIGQDQITGDGLELPGNLNISAVGTLQYLREGDGMQEFGFPSALSIYLGGKTGKYSGFLLELPVLAEDGTPSITLGSLKWNAVRNLSGINVGFTAFSTTMAGPAYGYELLSTGAMGMNVAQTGSNAMGALGLHMEHGSTIMSQFMSQDMGMMEMNMNMGDDMMMGGAATGMGVSLQNDRGFVYFSRYYASAGVGHEESPILGSYLRIAFTPTVAGFNLGFGGQLYRGDISTGMDMMSENMMDKVAVATTLDFQAQGFVGSLPVGLYVTRAMVPRSAMGKENIYNTSTGADNSATGILLEVSPIRHLSLSVGYVEASYAMDGKMMMMDPMMNTMMMMDRTMVTDGTATSIGADYMLAPNQRLGIKHVAFGGDLDASVVEVSLTMGF